MSKINLKENLFIGVQELTSMQNFLASHFNLLGMQAKTFGLIENADLIRIKNIDAINKEDRTSFKLSSPGNLKIQINSPSYAFAYPNNLISWTKNRIIELSDDYKNNIYWVKISYQEEFIEEGSFKMDSEGNVIGIGTNFVSKLRGEPGFPSRIKLYTYDGMNYNPQGIYIVTSVNSDTNICISSETGTIGNSNLLYYYSILGTFPEGTNISEAEQNLYSYDGCLVEFVKESVENEPPSFNTMKNNNNSFYIARISVSDGGVVSVEDKRFVFENEGEEFSKWFSLK